MKKMGTMLLVLIIALALILCSCNYISSNVVTLHLSQTVCQLALNGVTPEEFCSTRGNDTYIKGKYLSANVDEDGCLILKVNSGVIKEWKSSILVIQILQCVLGDSRDIDINLDYSMDALGFMENAHSCGLEISDDFTQVIAHPNSSRLYSTFVMPACVLIQMFEGKTCKEIKADLRDEFRFDEISVICGNEAASSDESGILRVPEQPPQLALKKVHVIFLSF